MSIKYTLILINVVLMFIIMIILYYRERVKTKKLHAEFEVLKANLQKSKDDTDIEIKLRQLRDKVDSIINDTEDSIKNNINSLSNKKIMEFEEYVCTMFDKIDSNHKEVVFMYDMLNDKSERIKQMFADLSKVQAQVNELLLQASEVVTKDSSVDDKEVVEKEEFKEVLEFCKKVDNETIIENINEENTDEEVQIPVKDNNSDYQVQNEKIIKLYSLGYTAKDISKKLGIGVGEVALVNNLYKNRVIN